MDPPSARGDPSLDDPFGVQSDLFYRSVAYIDAAVALMVAAWACSLHSCGISRYARRAMASLESEW